MEKEHMPQANLNQRNVQFSNYFKVLTTAFLLLVCVSPTVTAQQQGQKTFSSADEACHALDGAVKSNTEKPSLPIPAPQGKKIIPPVNPPKTKPTRVILQKSLK